MLKHSVYFKIIEALQNAAECPLCKLEDEAAHSYLDSLLYEAVTDPKIRAELVKSRGYCHRHAHRLTGMRDNLGAAIIYQDQIKIYMDLFAVLSGNDRKQRKHNIPTDTDCPVCRNQLETRRYYLNQLKEGLCEPELQQAYESSSGLCIPHLAALLETVKDPGTIKYIYQIEERNLAGLWNELEEFIRKSDYRFREETFGSERDSWRKAIKKVAGNKDIF